MYWPFVEATAVEIGDRFVAAFARSLGDESPEEVAWRWATAIRLILVGLLPSTQNVENPAPITREEIERLLRFAFLVLAGRHPSGRMTFEALEQWGTTPDFD